MLDAIIRHHSMTRTEENTMSSPRRVLVTGATGMLGSHIVDRLAVEGVEIIATDLVDPIRGYAWETPGVDFRRRDIADDGVVDLVAEADCVIHVAAVLPSPDGDRARALFDVNVGATHRLFEAASVHGAKVVFASSGSVYGASRSLSNGSPARPFSESDAVNELDFYGLSKRVDELYAGAFGRANGMEWNALRCGVLYGPRLRQGLSTRFLLSVMDDLDSGRPLMVDGDPDAGLDWVDVHTAAECFVRAALDAVPSGALNVGTGTATRLEDVLRMLLSIAEADDRIAWTGSMPTGGFSGARYYDATTTRRVLGVDLKSDLRTGLASFLSWYRENAESKAPA